VTTEFSLTCPIEEFKRALNDVMERALQRLAERAASGATFRVLERLTWKEGFEWCRTLLSIAFSLRSAKAVEDDLRKRELEPSEVRWRTDAAYGVATCTTTFGDVSFPTFAYRDPRGASAKTRSPARDELFPLLRKCRSSALLIELESRLVGLHPCRKAEDLLKSLTYGEVEVEDTTMQRHAIRVGHLIDQKWLYKSRKDVMEILRERATRDAETGRPILYWSSDAHALRRYVNESWTSQWKMINGLRVWCVDRQSGATIHIGGEFTTGDAHYLTHRIRQLIESKILPADGDFGSGLKAQYAFIADGMPWLQQHIVPLLPGVISIVDAYHLIEYLAVVANAKGRPGPLNAKAWLEKQTTLLLGPPQRRERASPRKGGTRPKREPEKPQPPRQLGEHKHSGKLLLDLLATFPKTKKIDGVAALRRYVRTNLSRMDYLRYRARGLQIGSGAMESFHRTGSQDRLKRPGATWLPETLEAMFRLKMLELSGRWDEWWSQPDLFSTPEEFKTTTYRTRTGPQVPKRQPPMRVAA
jgi:hypothetical protein